MTSNSDQTSTSPPTRVLADVRILPNGETQFRRLDPTAPYDEPRPISTWILADDFDPTTGHGIVTRSVLAGDYTLGDVAEAAFFLASRDPHACGCDPRDSQFCDDVECLGRLFSPVGFRPEVGRAATLDFVDAQFAAANLRADLLGGTDPSAPALVPPHWDTLLHDLVSHMLHDIRHGNQTTATHTATHTLDLLDILTPHTTTTETPPPRTPGPPFDFRGLWPGLPLSGDGEAVPEADVLSVDERPVARIEYEDDDDLVGRVVPLGPPADREGEWPYEPKPLLHQQVSPSSLDPVCGQIEGEYTLAAPGESATCPECVGRMQRLLEAVENHRDCSTCENTGTVPWEPGPRFDDGYDEQPCPDCPEGARIAKERGR